MLSRITLVGALALLAAAPTANASQVLKLDLASAENAKPQGVAVQSAPLEKRTRYIVSVSGTGSLWAPDASAPVTCGTPERGPIVEPTPGRAATPPTVDAAIVFAAPRGVPFLGGFACVAPTPTKPPAQAALRMGTGGALAAAMPLGGVPSVAAPDHIYHYAVTGNGRPLQFQYADPLVYDNSGILTITIRTRSECRVVRCTGTTGKPVRLLTRGLDRPLPCIFASLPASGGQKALRGLCR